MEHNVNHIIHRAAIASQLQKSSWQVWLRWELCSTDFIPCVCGLGVTQNKAVVHIAWLTQLQKTFIVEYNETVRPIVTYAFETRARTDKWNEVLSERIGKSSLHISHIELWITVLVTFYSNQLRSRDNMVNTALTYHQIPIQYHRTKANVIQLNQNSICGLQLPMSPTGQIDFSSWLADGYTTG